MPKERMVANMEVYSRYLPIGHIWSIVRLKSFLKTAENNPLPNKNMISILDAVAKNRNALPS